MLDGSTVTIYTKVLISNELTLILFYGNGTLLNAILYALFSNWPERGW